jgi:hypothetical protein
MFCQNNTIASLTKNIMNTKMLFQHLLKNSVFTQARFLINIGPEKKHYPLPYGNRLWPIELFSLDTPIRRVGLMIWDDKMERLTGPYIHVVNITLEEYKFEGTAEALEVYLYFGQDHYCISCFDNETIKFEEC